MKRKVALALTTAALLISFLLVGCGVAPEDYAAVADQLVKAKEQITRLQNEIQSLEEEREAVIAGGDTAQAKIAALQGQVAELQRQVSGLKGQVELVGETNAETAENIVRHYYETHEYSATDLFICSDMASEVWNMLKAHGIEAVIIVGN